MIHLAKTKLIQHRVSSAVLLDAFMGVFVVSVLVLPRAVSVMPAGYLAQGPLLQIASKLRFEDLVAPVMAAFVIRNIRLIRAKLGGRVVWLGLAWIMAAGLATLVNTLGQPYPLWAGFAFWAKEIQYLVYLSFFVLYATRRSLRRLLLVAGGATVLTLLFIVWQLVVASPAGYYGVATIWELGQLAPSESGPILALLTVLCMGVFWCSRSSSTTSADGLLNALAITGIVAMIAATVLVGSRTGTLGLVMGSAVLGASWLSGRIDAARISRLNWLPGSTSAIRLGLLLIVFAAGAVLTIAIGSVLTQTTALHGRPYELALAAFQRFRPEALLRGFEGRWLAWTKYMSLHFPEGLSNPILLMTGTGMGSNNFVTGAPSTAGLTVNVDSQFLRRFLEEGLLGLTLWLSVVTALIIRTVRSLRFRAPQPQLTSTFLAFVAGVFSMGVTFEILQVIRVASVAYAVLGTFLGYGMLRNQGVGLGPLDAGEPEP